MLRFLRIASLLLCLHIAFVDADCTHSRGPSTIAANKRPKKPAAFWCGTGVAINSSNTCTHYTNRLVQLLGRHLCQRWLLLCTCLVVDPSNRLILMAWAFLSVINDSIPVPTIISVVTADQMDVSASIVANHISCYLPPHLGCPKGTQCNPVTCICDK